MEVNKARHPAKNIDHSCYEQTKLRHTSKKIELSPSTARLSDILKINNVSCHLKCIILSASVSLSNTASNQYITYYHYVLMMLQKIIIMLVIKSEPKLVTKKINPNLSLVSKRKNNLVE